MKKQTKTIITFIFFLIVLISAIMLLWKPLTNLLSNAETTRKFVSSFGILSPLAFIILIILQVLLAPIPGQLAGLAGGYIFGVVLGTIYSMIGLVIGSFIAFYLGRKLGRPFVEKIIKKQTLTKYDKIISKRGIPILFLIYILPIFPDDAICYIAGLTKIKIKNLVIVSAIGRLPGFIVLSAIGAGLAAQNTLLSAGIFIAVLIISLIIYIKKEKLEKIMVKILKKFTKNTKFLN